MRGLAAGSDKRRPPSLRPSP